MIVAWFYGNKISLISNRSKQLVNFIITLEDISDNNANLLIEITKRLTGRIFGDMSDVVYAQLVIF